MEKLFNKKKFPDNRHTRMCKAENKCSDLGRVSPRMLAYLIRLVSPLFSSSLRNLLFDFFSRGGLPVCARCRRKVDVPGEYLTGLNWNEAKKRNEGTIILRKRKGGKREREREHPPAGQAAVYTQLALPRVLHQLTSSSFWSSRGTRIPQELETLPTTTIYCH